MKGLVGRYRDDRAIGQGLAALALLKGNGCCFRSRIIGVCCEAKYRLRASFVGVARLLKGMKHKGSAERAYEWFLELPVPLVLGSLWLLGVTLVGISVVALYLFWVLLRTVGGF